jgi:hypothetical protein
MPDLVILAFTDFHGRQDTYRKAKQLISREQPTLVVVAGDLVNYDAEHAKQLLLELGQAGRPIYFVPGNMDNADLGDWPGSDRIHPLHGRCEHADELCLIGLGGSPLGPFKFSFGFTEESAARLLNSLAKNCYGSRMILVSHCPPRNTKIDRVLSGEHVGSISVREFVERVQPLLVISGHIHEAQGVDKIGSTTLVNTGAAQYDCFARIMLGQTVTVSFQKLL